MLRQRGSEPGIPGFRGFTQCPARCPGGEGAAQIVETQGVHGTMPPFGSTRRGVEKKFYYLDWIRLQQRKIRVQSRLLSITRCFSSLFFAALCGSDSRPPTGLQRLRHAGNKRLGLLEKRLIGEAADHKAT